MGHPQISSLNVLTGNSQPRYVTPTAVACKFGFLDLESSPGGFSLCSYEKQKKKKDTDFPPVYPSNHQTSYFRPR